MLFFDKLTFRNSRRVDVIFRQPLGERDEHKSTRATAKDSRARVRETSLQMHTSASTDPLLADLKDVSAEEARQRKREWNRGPVQDLFPRIPAAALERVLDLCIDKAITYNLSEALRWNARRYTAIVVAHVRHVHTGYDALLRDKGLERFAARQRVAAEGWKVLRQWCPWDDSNPLLEPCFRATLLPPEQREPGWDPMDIDDESDYASRNNNNNNAGDGSNFPLSNGHKYVNYDDDHDPMDLD